MQETAKPESTPEVQAEVQQTPEEKAMQYKTMQLEVFTNFIKDFEQEEKTVLDIDLVKHVGLADKQRDIEKREREELKRLEKMVIKKELNEVEDVYNGGNAKALRDRIAKSINTTIYKQAQALARTQQAKAEVEAQVAKARAEVQSSLNKKAMLHNLCTALLDKNYQLYLTHETMLEEERVQRQRLATDFGERMKEVQADLDVQKEQRQREIDENSELRSQIQQAIDAYKRREEAYRGQMDTHGKTISEIEKKLKQTIDGTVTKTIKEAEAEKAKFLKVTESVKDLSDRINGFMKKFDDIKTEMGDNSKKFESYQQQVETKKLEIRSLEAEIESIQLADQKHKRVTQEIAEERSRLEKQVEAMRNLSKALGDQLKALQ